MDDKKLFDFDHWRFRNILRRFENKLTLTLNLEKSARKKHFEFGTSQCFFFHIKNLLYNPSPDIFKDLSDILGSNSVFDSYRSNLEYDYYVNSILYMLCSKCLPLSHYKVPITNWLIWDDYGIKIYENIKLLPVNIEDVEFEGDNTLIKKTIKNYSGSHKFYLINGEGNSNSVKAILRISKETRIFVDNCQRLRQYGTALEVFPKFLDLGLYEALAYKEDISKEVSQVLFNEICQYVDFNYYSFKQNYKLNNRGFEKSIRIAYPWDIACLLNLDLKLSVIRHKEKMQEVYALEEKYLRIIKEKQERDSFLWKQKNKFRFNIINEHNRDRFVHFDSIKHTYIVSGKSLQSVTNIVENCFPKFDAQLHAKTTAAKMGISPQEVIDMWELKAQESRELGTAMHQKIENYYKGQDSWEDDTFRLFKMFADKVKLEPYRTEWTVYDTDHNIAGTIDFVDYQNGEYTIYDWKRSDKIIANGMPVKVSKYQEKGLYPLEHLENCAYYHYALQLSLYKFILERNYDMKISKLRLGIFHPSYDKPYVLEIPYLENEVKMLMDLRSEVIL